MVREIRTGTLAMIACCFVNMVSIGDGGSFDVGVVGMRRAGID